MKFKIQHLSQLLTLYREVPMSVVLLLEYFLVSHLITSRVPLPYQAYLDRLANQAR